MHYFFLDWPSTFADQDFCCLQIILQTAKFYYLFCVFGASKCICIIFHFSKFYSLKTPQWLLFALPSTCAEICFNNDDFYSKTEANHSIYSYLIVFYISGLWAFLFFLWSLSIFKMLQTITRWPEGGSQIQIFYTC